MGKAKKVQPKDEIKATDHNDLVEDVSTLETTIAGISAGPEGKQGPKGEQGEKGVKGDTGPAGKDGEVSKTDFDALVARVAILEKG